MTDFDVPSQLADVPSQLAGTLYSMSPWGPDARLLPPKSRMYTEGMIQEAPALR